MEEIFMHVMQTSVIGVVIGLLLYTSHKPENIEKPEDTARYAKVSVFGVALFNWSGICLLTGLVGYIWS